MGRTPPPQAVLASFGVAGRTPEALAGGQGNSWRAVSAPSHLIHGDLGGNVLFDDEPPPAVIDFSVYWRPVAFAAAIVVADALVWEGADARLLDAVSGTEDFGQYLIRALIYRAVTDWLLNSEDPVTSGGHDPWLPAVDLACQLAAS